MNYRFDDDGNVLPPIPKTILEINSYIKALVEEEALLQDVYAVGEISNFKNHYATGHFYLTLKDAQSEIRAVMFRSNARKLKFVPQDGMKVLVHGRIGVYHQAGTYQFYIDDMHPDGLGDLHVAYEQLKERLDKEGLFNSEHKKDIPKFPKSIGIITSSTGAAIRDIIKVSTNRYPCAKLVLYPSLVQGYDAPNELIKGVEYFNIVNNVDVIIIGRGGGSFEDLWAFNDEYLARAIYSSKIPIISAVGHEIDYTICDFVADARAATPSHAAEMATPDINELKYKIREFDKRAYCAIIDNIESYKAIIEDLANSKSLSKPITMLDIPILKLNNASEKLISAFQNSINNKKEAFMNASSKLTALNPMAVISRGYGAVFNLNDRIIKKVTDVNIGDEIKILIRDGEINANVSNVKRRNYNAKKGS